MKCERQKYTHLERLVMWRVEKKTEIEERRCGEHGLNAAAIKRVNLCQKIC